MRFTFGDIWKYMVISVFIVVSSIYIGNFLFDNTYKFKRTWIVDP